MSLQLTQLLEDAIRHAKVQAVGPVNRRAAAIFYVQTFYNDIKRKQRYMDCYNVFALLIAMRKAETLMSLLEKLRAAAADVDTPVPPMSNRGVRSCEDVESSGVPPGKPVAIACECNSETKIGMAGSSEELAGLLSDFVAGAKR